MLQIIENHQDKNHGQNFFLRSLILNNSATLDKIDIMIIF